VYLEKVNENQLGLIQSRGFGHGG